MRVIPNFRTDEINWKIFYLQKIKITKIGSSNSSGGKKYNPIVNYSSGNSLCLGGGASHLYPQHHLAGVHEDYKVAQIPLMISRTIQRVYRILKWSFNAYFNESSLFSSSMPRSSFSFPSNGESEGSSNNFFSHSLLPASLVTSPSFLTNPNGKTRFNPVTEKSRVKAERRQSFSSVGGCDTMGTNCCSSLLMESIYVAYGSLQETNAFLSGGNAALTMAQNASISIQSSATAECNRTGSTGNNNNPEKEETQLQAVAGMSSLAPVAAMNNSPSGRATGAGMNNVNGGRVMRPATNAQGGQKRWSDLDRSIEARDVDVKFLMELLMADLPYELRNVVFCSCFRGIVLGSPVGVSLDGQSGIAGYCGASGALGSWSHSYSSPFFGLDGSSGKGGPSLGMPPSLASNNSSNNTSASKNNASSTNHASGSGGGSSNKSSSNSSSSMGSMMRNTNNGCNSILESGYEAEDLEDEEDVVVVDMGGFDGLPVGVGGVVSSLARTSSGKGTSGGAGSEGGPVSESVGGSGDNNYNFHHIITGELEGRSVNLANLPLGNVNLEYEGGLFYLENGISSSLYNNTNNSNTPGGGGVQNQNSPGRSRAAQMSNWAGGAGKASARAPASAILGGGASSSTTVVIPSSCNAKSPFSSSTSVVRNLPSSSSNSKSIGSEFFHYIYGVPNVVSRDHVLFVDSFTGEVIPLRVGPLDSLKKSTNANSNPVPSNNMSNLRKHRDRDSREKQDVKDGNVSNHIIKDETSGEKKPSDAGGIDDCKGKNGDKGKAGGSGTDGSAKNCTANRPALSTTTSGASSSASPSPTKKKLNYNDVGSTASLSAMMTLSSSDNINNTSSGGNITGNSNLHNKIGGGGKSGGGSRPAQAFGHYSVGSRHSTVLSSNNIGSDENFANSSKNNNTSNLYGNAYNYNTGTTTAASGIGNKSHLNSSQQYNCGFQGGSAPNSGLAALSVANFHKMQNSYRKYDVFESHNFCGRSSGQARGSEIGGSNAASGKKSSLESVNKNKQDQHVRTKGLDFGRFEACILACKKMEEFNMVARRIYYFEPQTGGFFGSASGSGSASCLASLMDGRRCAGSCLGLGGAAAGGVGFEEGRNRTGVEFSRCHSKPNTEILGNYRKFYAMMNGGPISPRCGPDSGTEFDGWMADFFGSYKKTTGSTTMADIKRKNSYYRKRNYSNHWHRRKQNNSSGNRRITSNGGIINHSSTMLMMKNYGHLAQHNGSESDNEAVGLLPSALTPMSLPPPRLVQTAMERYEIVRELKYLRAVDASSKKFVGSIYIRREGGEKRSPSVPVHGRMTYGVWSMLLWKAAAASNNAAAAAAASS